MRHPLLGALVLVSVVGLAASAAHGQEIPQRDGFTLELGLGLGFTHVIPETGSAQNKVGLAPLSMSLGGFVTPDLAIMFRLAGTSYFLDASLHDPVMVVLGFYGVHVQYWINQRVFVSGGPGFALYDVDVWGSESGEEGFALGFRAGYAFYTLRNHALRVSLELIPAFFDGFMAMGEALSFEWQWF